MISDNDVLKNNFSVMTDTYQLLTLFSGSANPYDAELSKALARLRCAIEQTRRAINA